MKPLEEWLRESTSNYETLTSKTTDLADQMSSLSPEMILNLCKEIQELQASIAENDVKMYEIMTFIGPHTLDLAETGEYQRALEKAINASNRVASKARTYKNLLKKELLKLQDGQKMVSGYQPDVRYYSGSHLQKEF